MGNLARLCAHIPVSVNHPRDTGIHFLQYKDSTSHKKVLRSARGRRGSSDSSSRTCSFVIFFQVKIVSMPYCGVVCSESHHHQVSTNIISIYLVLQKVLVVKNPPANAADLRHMGSIPGSRRFLKERMETYSRILAWRIPWTEEPDKLQSIRSQTVGHDWSDMHDSHRWLKNRYIDWYRHTDMYKVVLHAGKRKQKF